MKRSLLLLTLPVLLAACSTRSSDPEAQSHHHAAPPPVSGGPELEITALNQSTVPQQKFINPLPVPARLAADSTLNGAPHYTLTMSQTTQDLGWRNANGQKVLTTVWTYNNSFPGPTIEALKGRPIMVTFKNFLPSTPLIRQSLPDGTVNTTGGVPHLHGGFIPAASDGNPMKPIPSQGSALYSYPNAQEAATLWYHDHSMGGTRTNVYAGLAGMYLLRDSTELNLALPSGAYELPLVIQDRTFTDTGQLYYPPTWSRFGGDTILVNGKIWPYKTVEPRKYRLRLLNGSNQRYYNLSMLSPATTSSTLPRMYMIGSDGGLLPSPVEVKSILLAPGERADVIVDFQNTRGNFILGNNAAFPYPSGTAPTADTGQVMQFRVGSTVTSTANNNLPQQLRVLYPPKESKYESIIEQADQAGYTNPNQVPGTSGMVLDFTIRRLTLERRATPLALTLNGKGYMDPPTETPVINTNEVWEFINLTEETHPMHLHLVEFRVLGRQPYDLATYQQTGKLKFTGPNVRPPAEEAGWKDTVNAPPGMVTRIAVRFSGYTGDFVWHCHILEHEDNDMMRPLIVRASP